MKRRSFLKFSAVAGATLAAGSASAGTSGDETEFVSVLVDTTRCIGCRSCELACAVDNALPLPDIEHDQALVTERRTSERQWTVVNRYETDKGEAFVKRQCMHCWQPACAAACLTNAMYKTHTGPVVWRSGKCMGCRFCMVACPFEIPKFEYDEWNPKILKCDMCADLIEQGRKPACVEACPTDALMFGMKRDLMEVARTRVYNHPDRYVHKIYGENEVGGTGWLYLAAVPFEQLGFRNDLGTTPYPEYSRDFLYGVPVALFGVPALLFGLHLLADREDAS